MLTGDHPATAPAIARQIGFIVGEKRVLEGHDLPEDAVALGDLLGDGISTIVAAVEQGRATFASIRRFLTYHLSDSVAELTPFVVWALSGGRFPLALGVLQIQCLDIGTDRLPALALGIEAPSPGVLLQKPGSRHLIDHTLVVRAFGVLGLMEAAVAMSAFVVGQMANVFACRSATMAPWKLGWWSNRLLLWAVGIELVALAGFLVVRPIARLLRCSIPRRSTCPWC